MDTLTSVYPDGHVGDAETVGVSFKTLLIKFGVTWNATTPINIEAVSTRETIKDLVLSVKNDLAICSFLFRYENIMLVYVYFLFWFVSN